MISPLRKRLARPTSAMWTVIGLLAAGRFVEFYLRSDSETLALGLETAQWTSLLLILVAAAGVWLTLAPRPRRPRDGAESSVDTP